jgi:thiamine-monophosphate kinase
VGDLKHILTASRVGAVLDVDALPAGPALARQPIGLRRRFAAAGGDDYELCFTAPAAQRDAIVAAGAACGTAVTRVGSITAEPGLRLVDADGAALDLQLAGWDHFSAG